MIRRQSIIFQRDIIGYGAQSFFVNDLHHLHTVIPFQWQNKLAKLHNKGKNITLY